MADNSISITYGYLSDTVFIETDNDILELSIDEARKLAQSLLVATSDVEMSKQIGHDREYKVFVQTNQSTWTHHASFVAHDQVIQYAENYLMNNYPDNWERSGHTQWRLLSGKGLPHWVNTERAVYVVYSYREAQRVKI